MVLLTNVLKTLVKKLKKKRNINDRDYMNQKYYVQF